MTTLTLGTYDCFHLGHLNMLKRAHEINNNLKVGVSSDFLNIEKKNKLPIVSIYDRYSLLKNLKMVDDVFVEDKYDVESKHQYMNYYNCDTFVIGDDWSGMFDEVASLFEKIDNKKVSVIYLPRTPIISTTFLLDKINYSNTINYNELIKCKPTQALENEPKINNIRCVLFHRNRKYQALHLLPYFYLFNSNNVAWFIDDTNNSKNVISEFKTWFYETVDKSYHHLLKMDSILLSYQELVKFKPNIGIITEMWKPHCDVIKACKAKMIFIDHGICVGTRPDEWFALESQNNADMLLVAGQMQYDYHLICNNKPNCHNISEQSIKIIGWPRSSLKSNLDWIWDMYNPDYNHRILIVPTSYYTEMIEENIVNFIKLVSSLCQTNKVVIRPHPIEHSIAFDNSVLFRLFEDSINNKYCYNLVIIPPHFNIHTPSLFDKCDLLLFDKSSLGYEYLIHDKPGISIGKLKWNKPTVPSIIDGFPHFDNISDITPNIVEEVINDGQEYQTSRRNLRNYVFKYLKEEWMSNFKQCL